MQVAKGRTVTSPVGRHNSLQGFTYPLVLVAIVVLTIAVGVATRITSTIMRREREVELIFRGMAYRTAIRNYYLAVPGSPAYPQSVADLLRDPRFMYRRYLRSAYPDPTGGKWRLIRVAGGGIAGVASRSQRAPLTRAHLPKTLALYAQAKHLSDWQFVFLPGKNM